jgi:hypothetical protein
MVRQDKPKLLFQAQTQKMKTQTPRHDMSSPFLIYW